MPLYHIVLLRLKPNTPTSALQEMSQLGKQMMGKVPGLVKIDFGPPVLTTRNQGYEFGLLAVLQNKEDLKGYASHPAHEQVNAKRLEIAEDTLAYDLEFE